MHTAVVDQLTLLKNLHNKGKSQADKDKGIGQYYPLKTKVNRNYI
jgi:hypothetical protein